MKIRRRKELGQNFLTNARAAAKMTERFGPGSGDLILEIGPGKGALTGLLAAKAEGGARICAVELDTLLFEKLTDEFRAFQNVRIVNADILKKTFRSFCRSAGFTGAEKKIRIIGNIPYGISKPLLMKLIAERKDIGDFMLMLQKEVADKLLAEPATEDYGPLSVLFSLFSETGRIMDLSPNSFSPAPKVRSTVIRGRFPDSLPFSAEEEEAIVRIVPLLFSHRRKTLRNNLPLIMEQEEDIAELLERCGLDPGARAEMLSPPDFACLARFINMKGKSVLL